jgi:hypothetical protein
METCPFCGSKVNRAIGQLSPEEELMVSQFIDAQFEASLLEEIEDVEVI